MKRALLAVLAVSLTGCGLLYTNVRLPRAYRSATPLDVKVETADRTATGEGCNQSLLYLFAWGDAGYATAVQRALEQDPGSFLYDVKADLKATSVLFGLYTKACTVVTGRVGKAKPTP